MHRLITPLGHSDLRKACILLMPRIRALRRSVRITFLAGAIGLAVWSGIFVVSYRVLSYFRSIAELGTVLSHHLLSMILITLFSLLIFSSMITGLSKLYQSKDLHLVHSMPVPGYAVFLARWLESTVDSAWMVVVYTLPVFLAYAVVYRAGIGFYVMVVGNLALLSLTASGISALLLMAAVVAIPADRLRNIFILLGISFFAVIYVAFRLLRPERLVDPEAFMTALSYLKALDTPASPFLPSTWAFDSLKASLSGNFASSLFHGFMSLCFAMTLGCAVILSADRIYFKGMSRAQTASVRKLGFRSGLIRSKPIRLNLLNLCIERLFRQGHVRAFAGKEIKTFLRDQTQWSQLFLIAALFFIYIYNFKVLPIEKAPIQAIYLQNLLSFLNIGLSAFVMSAMAARFAFPAVAMEGEAFWIVQSAPVPLKTFLWIKFWIYLLPLLVLTESVIVTTNLLLRVTPSMMILSTATILFLVPGLVSLAVGMGAAYPDFRSENPAQAVTGFGGLLYMLLSAGLIGIVIVSEAYPAYNIFTAGMRKRSLAPQEWVWAVAGFAFAAAACLSAIYFPIRIGYSRLSRHFEGRED